MELSKRLNAIAQMVKEETVADIGTDHGYLPIYLVSEKGLKKVIACDINQGPLNKAKENINERGLSDYIETRLGNGLEKVEPNECECITISGMGGMLVINILEEGKDVVESVKRLVLQPQHDIPKVREYVLKNGFKIEDEKMLVEDGKTYTVINAVKGEEEPYSEAELVFGRVLIERKDKELSSYVIRRKEKLEKIMENIKEKGDLKSDRFKELERERNLCGEVMKWL